MSDPNVPWPELSLDEWRDTYATLHMWTQIVGKTRLKLAPWQNHWWHVTLYPTARGLTTGPMPYGSRTLDVELDFVEHSLALRTGEGAMRTLGLEPMSVAQFYAAYNTALADLGFRVRTWPVPVEVEHTTRFPDDVGHASYNAEQANRLWRILM